jgi:hypothetical protein
MKPSVHFFVFIFQFCIGVSAFSQTVLNYQGRVVSGGTAFTGVGQFKFAIVSADGSTFYWKNDGTATAEAPATAVSLPVNKGLFSVQLGDASIVNMGTINSTALLKTGMKLRVWFNDGAKGWQQFIPDQVIELPLYTALNGLGVEGINKTKNIFYGYEAGMGSDTYWYSMIGAVPEYIYSRFGKQFVVRKGQSGIVLSFTVDLSNQLPAGSTICSVSLDCYDTCAVKKYIALYVNAQNLGSLKVELIKLTDAGSELVVSQAETGSDFVGGYKQLKLENLDLVNDGVALLRISGVVSGETRMVPVNDGTTEQLRLDRIVVTFK